MKLWRAVWLIWCLSFLIFINTLFSPLCSPRMIYQLLFFFNCCFFSFDISVGQSYSGLTMKQILQNGKNGVQVRWRFYSIKQLVLYVYWWGETRHWKFVQITTVSFAFLSPPPPHFPDIIYFKCGNFIPAYILFWAVESPGLTSNISHFCSQNRFYTTYSFSITFWSFFYIFNSCSLWSFVFLFIWCTLNLNCMYSIHLQFFC